MAYDVENQVIEEVVDYHLHEVTVQRVEGKIYLGVNYAFVARVRVSDFEEDKLVYACGVEEITELYSISPRIDNASEHVEAFREIVESCEEGERALHTYFNYYEDALEYCSSEYEQVDLEKEVRGHLARLFEMK